MTYCIPVYVIYVIPGYKNIAKHVSHTQRFFTSKFQYYRAAARKLPLYMDELRNAQVITCVGGTSFWCIVNERFWSGWK